MEYDGKNDLELLKGEFIQIYTQLDYLKKEEGKNLEALYYSKIGHKELELHEKEIEYLKLKRKVEILNSCFHRGVDYNLEEIEETIKKELESYYNSVSDLYKKITSADCRISNLVPVEKEVTSLYRKLAKRLHPDFCKEGEKYQDYWQRLQECYSTHDLDGMKSLELMLEFEAESEEDLEKDIDKKIEEIMTKIKNLYTEKWELLKTYPYNMKIYIEDEEWVKEKIESIKKEIDSFDLKIENLKNLYSLLIDRSEKIWVN